jgi:protein-S-isoprenylcysteine O-methyltransferase Ste14
MVAYDFFMLVALFVFLALFGGRTWMMRRRGIRVMVIGRGKRGLEKFLEMLLLVALPLWGAALLSQSLGGSIVFLPGVLSAPLFSWKPALAAGMVLIALGLAVFAAALVSFGASWRVGIDTEAAGKLVTGGIFAFSRNPIFLFMDMFFLGTFLVYPGIFFLVFAAGSFLGIHAQILEEEKFLETNYGEPYRDYRRRVRRYL